MAHEPRYGVKFVGYSADVIARKYGREVEYARLDFVSGAACMLAAGGFVAVPQRIDLKPFLESLPKHTSDLQKALLRQRNGESLQQGAGVPERGGADDEVRVSFGSSTISVAPGTVINRFIRQITKRFIEVERVLEQAHAMGLRIKRRPYSEYIDELANTGIARVESYGFALFLEGRLTFFPNYQVFSVKAHGPKSVSVVPVG